jgi:hypothetical protein
VGKWVGLFFLEISNSQSLSLSPKFEHGLSKHGYREKYFDEILSKHAKKAVLQYNGEW